jgi:hypothetical protein
MARLGFGFCAGVFAAAALLILGRLIAVPFGQFGPEQELRVMAAFACAGVAVVCYRTK